MEVSSETTPIPGTRNLRGRNLELVAERTAPAAATPQPDAARTAALEHKEAELRAALATVHAAFAILGSRALVILSAGASVGGFAWACADPSGWRVAAAAIFTAMVFWPALWVDRRPPS